MSDNKTETKTKTEVSADLFEGDLNLGTFLGRHEAFGVVSGRCSAAQAACLREIHEKKLYKQRCHDFGEFCSRYLHMARSNVEKIIRLLNEFGPEYFELSQLTRVSAETYRAIRPALKNGALHAGGDSIALIPANAARLTAAVADLRNNALPKPANSPRPVPDKHRLAELERRSRELISEFRDLAASPVIRNDLESVLIDLQISLYRVQTQI